MYDVYDVKRVVFFPGLSLAVFHAQFCQLVIDKTGADARLHIRSLRRLFRHPRQQIGPSYKTE